MKTSRFFLLLILFVCPFFRISAGVMILNGLTHFHNGMGGNTVSGIITMKNDGKKESRVVIYMQDLGLSCDKPVDYFDVNSHNRSLGKWLKTNVDEKVLQPGEEYEVSYSINVPSGKFEEGTYYSIIMVEVADPLREETPQGVKIDSKVRYAIQVIADIGSYKHPKLVFEKIQFKKGTSDSTVKVIQVKLKNEGDFMVKAKLNIEIFNNLGEKVKVVNGLQKKVYPTHCNDFEIELKGLLKGKYEGVLVADNGKDLFGENMTIEIE